MRVGHRSHGLPIRCSENASYQNYNSDLELTGLPFPKRLGIVRIDFLR
jgi:hypothetical protein